MTHQIIGYGEDALTYWALTTKLQYILDKLDKTKADDCLVFYRPSFGRGVNIGEFDAILATAKTVYLVESKWDESKEYKESRHEIVFAESQLRRHRLFTAYRNHWRVGDFPDWKDFADRFAEVARKNLEGHVVPKASNTLAKNLAYTLNRVWQAQREQVTKNVSLFITCNKHEHDPAPTIVANDLQFDSVQVVYQSNYGVRGFIRLDSVKSGIVDET
ncbi:MAG: hypothetical protein ACOVLE_14875 [Pirellula staleyi]